MGDRMCGRRLAPVVVALAAAVLGTTACASTTGGTAAPDPRFTPPPPVTTTTAPGPGPVEPTAVALLGDPRTIDACSLLRPSALAEFGTVAPGIEESFDYCRLDVDTAAGGTAAVRFGELEIVTDERELAELDYVPDPSKDGPLRFYELEWSDEECERRVLFADRTTMKIQVDSYESPEEEKVAALCDIAEVTADRVAAGLLAGDGAEHLTYPANSLGRVNACSALSDTLAASLLAGTDPKKTVYPAGHVCRWGPFPQPSVSVRFAKGETIGGPDAVEETIAGKQTSISFFDLPDYRLCLAETAHSVRSEIAVILARGPEGQDQACATARAAAAEVWAKLPG